MHCEICQIHLFGISAAKTLYAQLVNNNEYQSTQMKSLHDNIGHEILI